MNINIFPSNWSRSEAKRCSPYSVGKKEGGLSLIELLIAIALGLVLTLGVTQIYLSGSQTYRQTQGLAHAQETTRFVSAIIKPDLRSAGSVGCLALMGLPLDAVVDNRINGVLPVPMAQAIQGWEFNNSGPGDNITLANNLNTPAAGNWTSGTAGANLPASLAGSAVSNSDVFIVNAVTPVEISLNAANPQNGNSINLTGSTGLEAGSAVIATRGDCSEGELFQKTNDANASSITIAGGNVNPGNNGNNFNLNYDSQSRIYEFVSTAFYVGVGTNGEPALFRRRVMPLQAPQELVSGVESIQLLYGVNTVGVNAADTYVPANEVDRWEDVVSVRFSVLARSQDEVLDEANARTYEMTGTEVAQDGDGDRRARLVSVGTTALRTRM